MRKAAAEKAWAEVQKLVKAHSQVGVEGSRYRWLGPELPEVSAVEAFELLFKDGLPGPRRTALAGVVREALTVSDDAGPDAARRRQAQIDAVRQLAELASEVEELLANETEPPVMIRQVRAWVKRSGLDPVGQAGEATRFDRTKHRPIMGRIPRRRTGDGGAARVYLEPWRRGRAAGQGRRRGIAEEWVTPLRSRNGLDFGTSTIFVASADGIVPIGDTWPWMPSLVGCVDDGSVIVGEHALEVGRQPAGAFDQAVHHRGAHLRAA